MQPAHDEQLSHSECVCSQVAWYAPGSLKLLTSCHRCNPISTVTQWSTAYGYHHQPPLHPSLLLFCALSLPSELKSTIYCKATQLLVLNSGLQLISPPPCSCQFLLWGVCVDLIFSFYCALGLCPVMVNRVTSVTAPSCGKKKKIVFWNTVSIIISRYKSLDEV